MPRPGRATARPVFQAGPQRGDEAGECPAVAAPRAGPRELQRGANPDGAHQSPLRPRIDLRRGLAAITARRSVRITYRSLAEDKTICTRLDAYRLLFSRRSWYVIGRSSLHRGTRTFNLGRIDRIELLDDRYEIPQGFSVERYLRKAWHLIPESGPDREVVVRFSRKVAQNVAEVAWHKTQRLDFRPDGTLDFHVTVSGLGEISWWILGYGDQAEVLQPAELRKMIAAHAGRMLRFYPETAGPEIPTPHWRAAAQCGRRSTNGEDGGHGEHGGQARPLHG